MSDSASHTPERAEPAPISTVRAVFFVFFLALIVGGPLCRQFLGVQSPHLRAWVMFSGIGLNAMDVRFFERHADGSRTELEPFAELGKKRPASARQRRIEGVREVWNVVHRICRRRGSGMDLRVSGRRATKDGWVQEFAGKNNLCELRRRRGRRARQRQGARP